MGVPPLAEVLHGIRPDELIQLTARLVRIPSVDRAGHREAAVAELLADLLSKRGFDVCLQEVAAGRPNLIAVHDSGTPGPTLLFEAHTDVVTEGDPLAWNHPPFQGVVEGGRIYGRGSCDTKGNLAAAVVAASALKAAGHPRRGRLMLAFPVDEEGMMIGVKHFIEQGWADEVDAAIICEPEENQICIAQKGAMRVRITVHGVMAHGAMPLTGLNPVPVAAQVICRLGELEREAIERHGFDELLGYPSITPTVVRAPPVGDPQLNVVPEVAELLVDVRTVRGQDHDELTKAIRHLCSSVGEASIGDARGGLGGDLRERLRPGMRDGLHLSVELEVLEDRPWTQTGREEPIVRAVDAAVREVSGREPVYNGVPGATDGTFLSAIKGIPIVTIGAGDRFVPHQKNEWVDLDQLLETARIYSAAALLFLERGA